MVGVLVTRDSLGVEQILKAFSGKLKGSYTHPGWAPPMLDLRPSELELSTKASLAELKTQLIRLAEDPIYAELQEATEHWADKEQELKTELSRNKLHRQERRQEGDSDQLKRESQNDSRRKKLFKQAKRDALAPLELKAASLGQMMKAAKSERRRLSRTLQAEMHNEFWAHLWVDRPWSLASLFPNGPPTGTGDCCAPKLLHYARTQGLEPLGLAEIWCGPATDSKQTGDFYPACAERCQPLLGALLSPARLSLDALFEDESLLVVEKPAGLLSVPGREIWNQDSLYTRLRLRLPNLRSIHRLDMDTSGLVVYAKTRQAQASVQQLFESRRVKKVYQALLNGPPKNSQGHISLALAPDPEKPGAYRPSLEGKPAETSFRVLNDKEWRIEFYPLTGRSHQLRVHALYGLGWAIQGDRIYGQTGSGRLKLHAQGLEFEHPETGRTLRFESECPF